MLFPRLLAGGGRAAPPRRGASAVAETADENNFVPPNLREQLGLESLAYDGEEDDAADIESDAAVRARRLVNNFLDQVATVPI